MSHDSDPRPYGTTGSGSTGQSSTGSLLSDALSQVTRLVRGEVQLAKAEVAQNLRNAGLGIGLLVGAAVLALVALIMLAGALAVALAQVGGIGLGWAGLIVGVLVLAVAALLALRGSTPKNKGVPANDLGSKAHQPDGTDSSGQMEAMIADESMVPESTPNA